MCESFSPAMIFFAYLIEIFIHLFIHLHTECRVQQLTGTTNKTIKSLRSNVWTCRLTVVGEPIPIIIARSMCNDLNMKKTATR